MKQHSIQLFSGPLSMFGAKAHIAVLEKGLDVDLVMVPSMVMTAINPNIPKYCG